MRRTERTLHPKAEALNEHIIKFYRVAFGRKIRGNRLLLDAISSALEDHYTEDEIRIAFWVARCTTGNAAWLGERLRSGDMLPHFVLRHHGRLNNVTGKEAKRWLDELIARVPESNQVMITALYNSLPEDMKAGEKALLERMELRPQ